MLQCCYNWFSFSKTNIFNQICSFFIKNVCKLFYLARFFVFFFFAQFLQPLHTFLILFQINWFYKIICSDSSDKQCLCTVHHTNLFEINYLLYWKKSLLLHNKKKNKYEFIWKDFYHGNDECIMGKTTAKQRNKYQESSHFKKKCFFVVNAERRTNRRQQTRTKTSESKRSGVATRSKTRTKKNVGRRTSSIYSVWSHTVGSVCVLCWSHIYMVQWSSEESHTRPF